MTFATSFIRHIISLFYLILLLAGLAAVLLVGFFFFAVQDLPRVPEPLNRIIETPPTEIFASTGERIMILGGQEAVPLDRVSNHFIQAVIATEDHRFWEHHGVDKLRTLKALWVTFFEPGRVQGASTITQQLAKNLFFSFRQSYMRKFREMLVALQIEARYSKREILEAYLNQIAFGAGAHGIEQASRSFFRKAASELNLAEAALLAGLPKSPTRYNPYRYFQRAKERQKTVLMRMAAIGYITPADVERFYKAALSIQPQSFRTRSSSYFLDVVLNQLEDRYGPEILYHGGLKVMTTFDPQLQSLAVESLQIGLSKIDQILGLSDQGIDDITSSNEYPQGALVAVQTNSGAVSALVGGRDYSKSEFNRATQPNRLPGSGFKPFLFYAALESLKITPATLAVDKRITIPIAGAPDWVPRNFDRSNEGPMILKQAFMKSVNTIAAQLVEKTGPEAVIDVAHRCGIVSPLKPVYSVALGTSGVSPLEMASAFATFATGGIRHEPFFIRRVEDSLGHVLQERIVAGKRVLDAGITYQIVDMMRGVIKAGTGSIVRRMGFRLPAAGKTGTTDGYIDAWFTGFTPNLSACVWIGFDRGVGLRDARGKGITGGRGAAPIWADFMIKATEGESSREFTIPENIRIESLDPTTGAVADTWTSKPIRVALRTAATVSKPRQPLNIIEEDLSPD